MNDRTTLNPTKAKEYGLVHEIKSQLFPENVVMYTIYEPQQGQVVTQPGVIISQPEVLPVQNIDGNNFGRINNITK